MSWTRKLFKGNKVFAQVDDAGELVLDEAGMVEIRYRENDERTYKTRPDRLGNMGAKTTGPPGAQTSAEKTAGTKQVVAKKAATQSSGPRPSAGASRAPRSSKSPSFPVAPRPRAGSVVIYTDGACVGNPGPAGIGAVLLYDGHRREISEYLGEGTNNIAELTAVWRALESVRKPNLPVDLCTDSEYTIGMLARGWKAKANQELIEQIRADLARFSDLRFVKVLAHSGIPENERADELAGDAIRRALGEME